MSSSSSIFRLALLTAFLFWRGSQPGRAASLCTYPGGNPAKSTLPLDLAKRVRNCNRGQVLFNLYASVVNYFPTQNLSLQTLALMILVDDRRPNACSNGTRGVEPRLPRGGAETESVSAPQCLPQLSHFARHPL